MQSTPSTTANDHGRWVVEFADFRVQDEHQRRVLESVSRDTLSAVLRIWLRIITPGAQVIEREGSSVWTGLFQTRSQARHFVACFGGKLRSALRS